MSEIYDRQVKLFGEKKQNELEDSLVLLLGCGALGSQVANNLARAGVNLRIVDRDIVEESNLHRTLFSRNDIGKPKAEAMEEILDRSSEVDVEVVVDDFSSFNWDSYVEDVDIVVDCSDNMSTRYLLNRVSLKESIPWIHGSVVRYEGRSITFIPGQGSCFRCLYPEKPSPGSLETCHSAGIFNPIASFIASYQASETLKYLADIGQMNQNLLVADFSKNSLRFVEVGTKDGCVCSKDTVKIDTEEDILIRKTCEGYQVTSRTDSLDLEKIQERYGGELRCIFLQLTFSGEDVVLFENGRMQIKTDSKQRAKSIYTKILGV